MRKRGFKKPPRLGLWYRNKRKRFFPRLEWNKYKKRWY